MRKAMRMTNKLLTALAAGTLALFASASAGQAADRAERTVERASEMTQTASRTKYRASRRKATRVYGYTRRRVGGYSYDASDVTNTYGQTRSIFGSTNVFRDPMLDRQTRSGPFDHDFFYDSGMGLRGGNSPMLR
jgi:hypothetical protein